MARRLRSRHMPGLATTCPRTHSSRSSTTPAAWADSTSSMSSASISATSSPRPVPAASNRSRTLVRPDDRGPASSDSCPRGNPPPRRASNAVMPVGATTASFSPGSPKSPEWPGETAAASDNAVVRVRSRRRARSSDSRSGRASGIVFRFIFACSHYTAQPEWRSSKVRSPGQFCRRTRWRYRPKGLRYIDLRARRPTRRALLNVEQV